MFHRIISKLYNVACQSKGKFSDKIWSNGIQQFFQAWRKKPACLFLSTAAVVLYSPMKWFPRQKIVDTQFALSMWTYTPLPHIPMWHVWSSVICSHVYQRTLDSHYTCLASLCMHTLTLTSPMLGWKAHLEWVATCDGCWGIAPSPSNWEDTC